MRFSDKQIKAARTCSALCSNFPFPVRFTLVFGISSYKKEINFVSLDSFPFPVLCFFLVLCFVFFCLFFFFLSFLFFFPPSQVFISDFFFALIFLYFPLSPLSFSLFLVLLFFFLSSIFLFLFFSRFSEPNHIPCSFSPCVLSSFAFSFFFLLSSLNRNAYRESNKKLS